jgi:hypothetical protein
MGYTIDFIGMVNFFDLKPQGRLVLLPNGMNDLPPNVPQHFAGFFVHSDDVLSSDWSAFNEDPVLTEKKITEFRILSRSTVAISGQEESGESRGRERDELDTSKHAHLIPRLREIDPEIRIVPEKADTIAQMPLRHGVLQAFTFGSSAVSQLSVPGHTGPVTVTVHLEDGSRVDTFTVKEGSEIVLANLSDAFVKHDGEETHFQLYAKLDERRKRDRLTKEPPLSPDLPRLNSDHPYLRLLLALHPADFPASGCSNTGCCAGQIVRRAE